MANLWCVLPWRRCKQIWRFTRKKDPWSTFLHCVILCYFCKKKAREKEFANDVDELLCCYWLVNCELCLAQVPPFIFTSLGTKEASPIYEFRIFCSHHRQQQQMCKSSYSLSLYLQHVFFYHTKHASFVIILIYECWKSKFEVRTNPQNPQAIQVIQTCNPNGSRPIKTDPETTI